MTKRRKRKAAKEQEDKKQGSRVRHLVKRHGHIEEYDKTKIYASVYAAALGSHMGERSAEELASDIAKKVHQKLSRKQMMLSIEIRNLIIEELGGIENDVAFMYVHLLDIN